MRFKNLNENIEFKTYPEDVEKVNLHIVLPRTVKEDLNELKAIYDNLGIDEKVFSYSTFIGMLISNYIENVPDDVEGLLNSMVQMKLYLRKVNSGSDIE